MSSARAVGAATAVALHAAAAGALLAYEPARTTLAASAPLMVALLAPPKPEPKPEAPVEIVPPKPKPIAKPQPKPKPVVKPRPRPPEPAPPVLAAATPTPEPAPVEAALPPAEVAPPPPPELPPPAPVVVAPPAPPPPPPVTPPVFNADYLRNPPPAYPALSRRIGEKGRVILRVLVSPAGTAETIEIRASSGYTRLDQAAREAVQRWKFVPARRGEQPIAAWVLIPVSFRLEG